MTFKKIGALTALALSFAPAALAQDAGGPSWNYFTAGYTILNFDDSTLKVRGLETSGTAEINKNFFITGSFFTGSDNLGLDTSIDSFGIGAGYKRSVSENVDMYVGAGYVSEKGSIGAVSATIDGFAISGGLRGMATPKLELGIGVAYADYGSDGNSTSVGGTATYMFSKKVGLGLNVSRASDVTAYGANLRLNF